MVELSRRMRPLLGTYVEIGANGDNANALIDSAFEKIREVQNLLSFHDPDSELSKLNRSLNKEVELSAVSICALRLARAMTRLSGGLFNFTVGSRLQALKVLPKHDPNENHTSGCFSDLVIRGRKAMLRNPVQLTLDGIAKGLAIDLAVKDLQAKGAMAGWANAGGDLRVFGDVSLPVTRREEDGNFRAIGNLKNAALATSRVCQEFQPSFPGHIVSSASNEPEPGTWTVIATRAWLADALTKVASLAQPEERLALVENLGGHLV